MPSLGGLGRRIGTGIVTGGYSELARAHRYGAERLGVDTNLNRGQAAEDAVGGIDPEGRIAGASGAAGAFAGVGEQGYGDRTGRMLGVAGDLDRIRQGEDSYSLQQLRNALTQNVAAQKAMAAGARPANAAMSARTAMRNAAQLGSALSGQQALAGIAERNAATQSLANMYGQMRGQDLQAALGSRQSQLAGLGNIEDARTRRFLALTQTPTEGEQLLSVGQDIGKLAVAASDRERKTDVRPGGGRTFLDAISASGTVSPGGAAGVFGALGDIAQGQQGPAIGISRSSGTGAGNWAAANRATAQPAGQPGMGRALLDSLSDSTYRYRDPSAPGAAPGRQLGIMAQDLERSPLGAGAVMDSPNGKMVDTTRLAHALAAGAANLNERLAALESRRG